MRTAAFKHEDKEGHEAHEDASQALRQSNTPLLALKQQKVYGFNPQTFCYQPGLYIPATNDYKREALFSLSASHILIIACRGTPSRLASLSRD